MRLYISDLIKMDSFGKGIELLKQGQVVSITRDDNIELSMNYNNSTYQLEIHVQFNRIPISFSGTIDYDIYGNTFYPDITHLNSEFSKIILE